MFKCNMIHDFKKIGFILCEKSRLSARFPSLSKKIFEIFR